MKIMLEERFSDPVTGTVDDHMLARLKRARSAANVLQECRVRAARVPQAPFMHKCRRVRSIKEKLFEQFYELVHMMTIDDRIMDEEMGLCRVFAKKFGYNEPQELVSSVAQNIKNGQPWEETQKRVVTLL